MPDPDGEPTELPRPQVAARAVRALADRLAVPLLGVLTDDAPAVSGVTLDSRTAGPGDLFAALPGAHQHGAWYSGQAAAAGASAVLTDPAGQDQALGAGLPVLVLDQPRAVLGDVAGWVYGYPAERLILIGITGTNGKTTTAYLADAGLRAAGHSTGLLGTVQTRVGDLAFPSARTTPEAPQLQALLALMVQRGCTAAVMEVSSHALALGRVDGLVFDVAVFTNLTQDHLDFHTSMEDYFQAKATLFTAAKARAAVINIDDHFGRRLAGMSAIPVSTISGVGGDADWRAVAVRSGPRGSQFTALGPDGSRWPVAVRLPGAFNVANALAALAALAAIGLPVADASAGVSALAGVPGRMEPVEAGQPFLALVDYAHTPAALSQLLTAVRRLTPGRVLVVVGCGGDRDPRKRPLMGAAAISGSDLAVFTSDNPRSEDPNEILAAMVEGASSAGAHTADRMIVEPDRTRAIARAVAAAGAGDVVVIAGKGHETGQEIAGTVIDFDDRVELRRAIDRTGVVS